MENKRTYISYKDVAKRNQIEYKKETTLLDDKGNLLVKGGWAKRNIFKYERNKTRPRLRGKEWDFYQVSNGHYMVQMTCANISIGGYISTVLADISGKTTKLIAKTSFFLGKKNKVVMAENGDKVNYFMHKQGSSIFIEDTKENKRTIEFSGMYKGKKIETKFEMDLFKDHENITIVTPFKKKDEYRKRCFFLTMKQNCMPAKGYFRWKDEEYKFDKKDTFAVLDWGRGVWPYKSVWYWGNGATHIKDEEGKDHIVGFEVTWGIGDESNATETCLFYDGKAHKFGSCDVDVFPKPDKYMEPWHIVSEDGRFDLTMTPNYDHHSDLNVLIMRMHSHQVHGLWNGKVTLDDGKVIEFKNVYAFCEYVENRW